MTPGCGKVSHPQAHAYTPKAKNASNPFANHVSSPGKKMNHNTAASNFYGQPSIKSTGFKIGKY